jgi:hypothetical protein
MAGLMPSYSMILHGAPKTLVVFIISMNVYAHVLFCLICHFRPKHWTQKWLKTYPTPIHSVKVKYFTLEQAMKTQRGSRDNRSVSLNSTLDGGQSHAPAALTPGKAAVTHCTGGWVGPRTCLDRCDIARPHRDSILGLFSP